MEHTQESGLYLPHFLAIKVRGDLFLSLGDACQNGDTNTTTTLPNVGIFTALGAAELVHGGVREPVSSQATTLCWWPVAKAGSAVTSSGGGGLLTLWLVWAEDQLLVDLSGCTGTNKHLIPRGRPRPRTKSRKKAHLSHWLLVPRVPPHTQFTPGIC